MQNPEMANLQDHYPHRDDQVAAWIKERRDEIRKNTPLGEFMNGYRQLDDLLDEYRLAADTGRSLEEMVNDPNGERDSGERHERKKKRVRK
jgi:hypothetical protein